MIIWARRERVPVDVAGILERLRTGLDELYGDRLRSLHLAKSPGRGVAPWHADVEVLIVLDEIESTWDEIQHTSQLTADISLEFGVTVGTVFTTERRWLEDDTNGFLQDMRRDGVEL